MSASTSTQISSQKAAKKEKKSISAVNNTVNKLDRRSCEKLHKNLGLAARFS